MTTKKYCAFGGCKRLVDLNKRYCDKHKPKQQHTSSTSEFANQVHSSNRWRKTSRLYRQVNPICEQCLREASSRASERGSERADERARMVSIASSVDHIKPLFAGGEPYDWSNLQSLCDYHHALKSQQEREREQKK